MSNLCAQYKWLFQPKNNQFYSVSYSFVQLLVKKSFTKIIQVVCVGVDSPSVVQGYVKMEDYI